MNFGESRHGWFRSGSVSHADTFRGASKSAGPAELTTLAHGVDQICDRIPHRAGSRGAMACSFCGRVDAEA